ncbi:MAG: hypothetical protein BWY93_00041 [Euryarchaeota archaeon ADurb.BinA087]|mgnify:CR=1 FL=1|nr:MAG: hypothetical protein BWY93_00041 [Euryarchaeota archaeon ADurb.BinA087]
MVLHTILFLENTGLIVYITLFLLFKKEIVRSGIFLKSGAVSFMYDLSHVHERTS